MAAVEVVTTGRAGATTARAGARRSGREDGRVAGTGWLVACVLDDPDRVPLDVLRRAVVSLEGSSRAPLGDVSTDPRVVLQRRFGRALALRGRVHGGGPA